MKAIQVQVPGGPENLIEVDLPDPLPGPGQVRVKACAIGVGRPDVLIRKGTYKWMPPLPAIPGAELAGVVDAVGEGVTQWQMGDRVLVSARELPQRGGCYAEAIVVPEDAPYRLPDTVSFDDAVSLPNLQLALALLQSAGPMTCEAPHVLITGASGGVAGMLCQVAKLKGFVTIGTSRSRDKAQFALAHGFDHVICTDDETPKERLAQITKSKGLNLVFDHLGGQSLVDGLKSLAPFGTLVSYNIVQGPPTEDTFQVMRQLLEKSLAIRCFSMHTFDADRDTRRGLMNNAIDLLAQQRASFSSPQIFKLSEVQKTHALLDQGLVSGKLVMHP
ncbi:zinc-dependent alcohol dehydrogenase family protein [Limnohabitans sp. Rim8]|uniref:zinc-dependent alcohol dehydrogenase family protein n=1 Tax=Limnohabitans sp. Rim8 TaxID=1100718 RepID=UPI0025E8BD10|nr:zinc-dependent alcohol dehydrogenase family protein [Limnohabitans sp. Rim8]